MKKKHLEMLLQNVPNLINPNPVLEQYITPASIAADILFNAYQLGDVKDKIIFDLGCGTGIFAIGSSILGGKQICGFDIDKDCISIAKNYAQKNKFDINFYVKDVKDIFKKTDTIFMNPPFGAQKGNLNADRIFIEKGFEIGEVIYSLHLSKTIDFIEKMIKSLRGTIVFQKEYIFPIKRQFDFHKKEILEYKVTLIRIKTK